MSAPRFTKGPWVYKWFGGPQIGGGRGGATAICTLWGSWRTGNGSRQERANRDLICAAPELYEAGEEAAKELTFLLGSVAGGDIPLRNLLAALAKARGEQVSA